MDYNTNLPLPTTQLKYHWQRNNLYSAILGELKIENNI